MDGQGEGCGQVRLIGVRIGDEIFSRSGGDAFQGIEQVVPGELILFQFPLRQSGRPLGARKGGIQLEARQESGKA